MMDYWNDLELDAPRAVRAATRPPSGDLPAEPAAVPVPAQPPRPVAEPHLPASETAWPPFSAWWMLGADSD